jgi:hypothetical protein
MYAKLTAVAASAIASGLVLVSVAGGVGEQELCFGATPTITSSGAISGTMGDDVILGSEGSDEILGFAGNDKICGAGGDDRIGGGPGDDQVDGGPGNDQIDTGPGNDTILGGEGDDVIRCGTENDVVDGGPGTNTAETSGFEACESVTNASPPQGEPALPLPQRVTATLSPGQAVPRPKGATRRARGVFSATVTTTATGGATLAWRLTFTRLTGPARTAHVHQGRPGRTGPILVRLCGPCRSGMSATAQVRTQAARMAILQGNAYVEIHTKRNPRGEIRGQIRRIRQ